MKIYASRRPQSEETIDILRKYAGTGYWVRVYDWDNKEFMYHKIEEIDEYSSRYCDPIIWFSEYRDNDPHLLKPEPRSNICKCPYSSYNENYIPVLGDVLSDEELQETLDAREK